MYGFGVLWRLFKSGLLVTNAVAILHKQRFLRKCECCAFAIDYNNTAKTPEVFSSQVERVRVGLPQ